MSKIDELEKYTEFLEKFVSKGFDITLEYERSLAKYLIAGNGAALVFILTLLRSTNGKQDWIGNFILPMWAFGLGLLLSVFGFFLAYLYARKASANAGKMLLLLKRLKTLADSPSGGDEFEKGSTNFNNCSSRLDKKFPPLIYIAQTLAALTFCSGLVVSLWKVSDLYG